MSSSKKEKNIPGKISVIIPIYKVEKYLEKCLRSIMENTYHNLEIIGINDGSPDGCLDILTKLQEEDSRIVIVNQKNQGVQIARNNGIIRATGDYIAFIDSDDYIHPQYFESMLNCLKYKQADIVICGCQRFSENELVSTNKFSHINYKRLSDYSLNKSYYGRHMVWGRLFKRKDLEDKWFSPNVRTSDDTLFNLSIIASLSSPVIYETETPLYYYRQREGSIVRTSTYERMIDFSDWYILHIDDKKQDGPWAWILLMQAIKFALSYRYEAILRAYRDNINHANKNLRQMEDEMLRNRHIHIDDKIIHYAMIRLPMLYRYFRLKNDPTMKTWEKRVKKSR